MTQNNKYCNKDYNLSVLSCNNSITDNVQSVVKDCVTRYNHFQEKSSDDTCSSTNLNSIKCSMDICIQSIRYAYINIGLITY